MVQYRGDCRGASRGRMQESMSLKYETSQHRIHVDLIQASFEMKLVLGFFHVRRCSASTRFSKNVGGS